MAKLFVKAVPGKVIDLCGTVAMIVSKGIAQPLEGLFLAGAITCLIFGAVVFVFIANTRIESSLLLVFLFPLHKFFSHISSGWWILHESGPH